MTRANDRRLIHGLDEGEWVRNGDRWTVLAGTIVELYLEHRDTGARQALPAGYVEGGHVAIDYASTIHRAQGATVDEAHLLLSEHTDAKQLYVGTTRGRTANHIHTHPLAIDDDHHGPSVAVAEWTPTDAVTAALQRAGTSTTALNRRRQLRDEVASVRSHDVDAASTTAQQRLAALRNPRRSTGRTL